MPTYKFIALTADGARIEGSRAANSQDEILEKLRLSNQIPISIQEIVDESRQITLLESFNKVKTKDIATFCRQFYTMIRAGVIILNCLDILRYQTENKKLRIKVADIYEKVQKGMTFSEAMAAHNDVFPELLINMVGVGEVSGTLDIIMERMAVHFEKENKITAKVKSALIYPAVLAVVATTVVVLLLTFVMPTFVQMFTSSGVALPLPTRILIVLSDALTHYGIVVLAVVLAIGYGLMRALSTEKGRLFSDRVKLKIPVVNSTVQKVYTSRFTRTMATLITSGIPLIKVLEVVSRVVGNKVVESALLDSIEDVKKGISLSVPIKNCGLFPPMVYYMISIGEESGSMDEVLDRTANYFDDEVDTAITRMVALMEPLMILVMALLVGGMAVAMVMPMFDMLQTVDQG